MRNIADILAEEQDFSWEIQRSDCVVLIGSSQASSFIQNRRQENEDDCITFDGKIIHDEFTGNKELLDRLIVVFLTERAKNDWLPNGLDEKRIFNLLGEKIWRGNPALDHLEYSVRRVLGETVLDW